LQPLSLWECCCWCPCLICEVTINYKNDNELTTKWSETKWEFTSQPGAELCFTVRIMIENANQIIYQKKKQIIWVDCCVNFSPTCFRHFHENVLLGKGKGICHFLYWIYFLLQRKFHNKLCINFSNCSIGKINESKSYTTLRSLDL